MCTKKSIVSSTYKKSVLRSLTFSVRINYEKCMLESSAVYCTNHWW